MNWPTFPEPSGHSPRPHRSSSLYPPPSPRNAVVQMPSPNPALDLNQQVIYADGQTTRAPGQSGQVIYIQGGHHHHRRTRHHSHSQPSPSHQHSSHAQPPVQSHSHRHSHSQPPHSQPVHYSQPQHNQYPTQSHPGRLVPLQHPDFEYSRCTGRKKALCIGINYVGQREELHGCINDAEEIYNFLRSQYGFRSRDMVMLRDDARDPRNIPTRRNMIDAMKWLVKDAQPHDSLFIHYSGHGGQTKDLDGDEIDGLDEDIYPVDFKKSGIIVDDLLHELLVKPLPKACRLTAVFDSCHSGSILDLPFLYHSDGRIKSNQVTPAFRKDRTTPADVISFSGCKDSQTSADTREDGVAVGAMSYAFILSLKRNPNQTYLQLLKSVRAILNKRYSQKPQLSSSHRIDTHFKFIVSGN